MRQLYPDTLGEIDMLRAQTLGVFLQETSRQVLDPSIVMFFCAISEDDLDALQTSELMTPNLYQYILGLYAEYKNSELFEIQQDNNLSEDEKIANALRYISDNAQQFITSSSHSDIPWSKQNVGKWNAIGENSIWDWDITQKDSTKYKDSHHSSHPKNNSQNSKEKSEKQEETKSESEKQADIDFDKIWQKHRLVVDPSSDLDYIQQIVIQVWSLADVLSWLSQYHKSKSREYSDIIIKGNARWMENDQLLHLYEYHSFLGSNCEIYLSRLIKDFYPILETYNKSLDQNLLQLKDVGSFQTKVTQFKKNIFNTIKEKISEQSEKDYAYHVYGHYEWFVKYFDHTGFEAELTKMIQEGLNPDSLEILINKKEILKKTIPTDSSWQAVYSILNIKVLLDETKSDIHRAVDAQIDEIFHEIERDTKKIFMDFYEQPQLLDNLLLYLQEWEVFLQEKGIGILIWSLFLLY